MLIKKADDKTPDLEILKQLLVHPGADAETRKRIEQEIRNIVSGRKGEEATAYEIDFYFGASKNWAVVHDLRVEHAGRVAQFDHLLINRFLDIWVCESKRFSEGIAINEQGECAMFWNGKAQGIGSPYEQNAKHVAVLKSLCDDGVAELPKRLGFSIKPTFHSLVIVSKEARITRPKTKGWWHDSLVKTDQIKAKIEKSYDSDNNPLQMAKVISSETLERFAYGLADLHTPIMIDWRSRFGLIRESSSPVVTTPAAISQESVRQGNVTESESKKSKLACKTCGTIVAYNVAKFCWFNKARFAGHVYCMDCQKNVSMK